jgi:tyrosyl-tRNA synthetase
MEKDLQKQLRVILKGTEEVLPMDEFERKLKRSIETGVPLRVKLGLDPSAPDIHLGHAVVLRKLRQFQDLGHTAVLIVGDFTGMVGDPSQRVETRKRLTYEEVRANASTYVEQVCRILDEKRTEVVYNSEWLAKLTMEEVLRLTAAMTVARMLERDDFAKRFSENRPISLVEFMYPFLQGMDSVAIRADVELGGTDQKFNLLVGRDLQREYGQEPQVILTLPLLEGIKGDGQKMSKSLDNYIGITEPPSEIFGKVMRIHDGLIVQYLKLATDADIDEVVEIEKGLKAGQLHPGETKRGLAREIVALYYSQEEAEKAEHEFNIKFKPGYAETYAKNSVGVAEAVAVEVAESLTLPSGPKIWIAKLLVQVGFAKSNSEARRLIEQSAVELDGDVITDPNRDLETSLLKGRVLKVGKRRVGKFTD